MTLHRAAPVTVATARGFLHTAFTRSPVNFAKFEESQVRVLSVLVVYDYVQCTQQHAGLKQPNP
jgi:hypothetical protein